MMPAGHSYQLPVQQHLQQQQLYYAPRRCNRKRKLNQCSRQNSVSTQSEVSHHSSLFEHQQEPGQETSNLSRFAVAGKDQSVLLQQSVHIDQVGEAQFTVPVHHQPGRLSVTSAQLEAADGQPECTYDQRQQQLHQAVFHDGNQQPVNQGSADNVPSKKASIRLQLLQRMLAFMVSC